jgi:ribA/ribD-fused uncharacterized protein
MSKFHFFWMGPFSQWAMRDMVIDGVEYNCCEQYMMSEKARLFKDEYALKEILKSDDPKEQKAWGRQVKGFVKDEWEAIARDVVYKANYAKFTQHPNLKDILMATGDKVIVEASPEDCIWGIGLRASDSRAQDPKKWRGTNWLGEALMQVREQLKREDADQH